MTKRWIETVQSDTHADVTQQAKTFAAIKIPDTALFDSLPQPVEFKTNPQNQTPPHRGDALEFLERAVLNIAMNTGTPLHKGVEGLSKLPSALKTISSHQAITLKELNILAMASDAIQNISSYYKNQTGEYVVQWNQVAKGREVNPHLKEKIAAINPPAIAEKLNQAAAIAMVLDQLAEDALPLQEAAIEARGRNQKKLPHLPTTEGENSKGRGR
jgi:hypothetical protein